MSVTTAPMPRRLAAEFVGTFALVFVGCGSAVLAGGFVSGNGVHLGIGFLGVALAFGLTVTAMAYAVGHLSGGHFNPAVTIGLATGKRFPWGDAPAYIVTQVVGAIVGAAVLLAIASGQKGFSATRSGFATNGYGSRSPGGYSVIACLVCEVVVTAIFVFIILGATDKRSRPELAPISIGIGLILAHLVSIPVTNASVNPARSIGPALFAGSGPLSQLWLFIVAPTAGGLLAGLLYPILFGSQDDPPSTPPTPSADEA